MSWVGEIVSLMDGPFLLCWMWRLANHQSSAHIHFRGWASTPLSVSVFVSIQPTKWSLSVMFLSFYFVFVRVFCLLWCLLPPFSVFFSQCQFLNWVSRPALLLCVWVHLPPLCLCVFLLLLVWTLFSFHGFLFFYLDLITALSKAHFLFLTCRLVCLTFGSYSVYPDIISVHICIQRRQRNYWCCQFKPETIEDVAYHLFIMDRNVIFFSIHTWQNVFHHKNERIISSRTFL